MTIRNGFAVDALEGFVQLMRENPEAGCLSLRTHHSWAGGGAVDGRTDAFELAGNAIPRRFTFRNDFPQAFGGQDTGPAPGEMLLSALGACILGTFAEKAAFEGVTIEELSISLEISVDLRGRYELGDVRAGATSIQGTLSVRAQAEQTLLEALGRSAIKASPVADTLARGATMDIAVRRQA